MDLEYPVYSSEQLEKCKEWLVEHDFYEPLLHFEVLEEWHLKRRIKHVDCLSLRKVSFVEWKGERNESFYWDMNYDIHDVVSSKSRYEDGCLWYQILMYIS